MLPKKWDSSSSGSGSSSRTNTMRAGTAGVAPETSSTPPATKVAAPNR